MPAQASARSARWQATPQSEFSRRAATTLPSTRARAEQAGGGQQVNLPSQITTGGKTTEFEYSADEQRLVRRDDDTVRHFVDDLYERLATRSGTTLEERFRLYAGPRLVGEVVRKPGAADNTLFMHSDDLGSTDTISGASLSDLQTVRFDAFGAELGASSTEITRVGYTGQEHDRDLGLIDMHGRIYDPLAGRFLSQDPVMQAPFWSQGPNRYSYVFNDPINATDPSGFLAEDMVTMLGVHYPNEAASGAFAGGADAGASAVDAGTGASAAAAGQGLANAGAGGVMALEHLGARSTWPDFSGSPASHVYGRPNVHSTGSSATKGTGQGATGNGNVSTIPQSKRCLSNPFDWGCINPLSGLDPFGGGVVIEEGGQVGARLLGKLFVWLFQRGAAQPLVLRFTEQGIAHSFDRHAAQWFGRAVTRAAAWCRGRRCWRKPPRARRSLLRNWGRPRRWVNWRELTGST
jgi:RHS repeat-associated protein